ncbi:hypothetical protein J2Y63_002400 [Shinella sp. BE166]|uniref:hypothetical protein n=1 Tax=Shinella sp. BE166 TaxID=3373918 RepID=UPI003EB7EF18
MAGNFLSNLNPDALMAISSGLLTGRTPAEQIGGALGGYSQVRKDQRQRNVTMDWLQKNSPDLLPMLDAGMSPADLLSLSYKQKREAEQAQLKAQQPQRQWVQLPDGRYGWADKNSGGFEPLGTAVKPEDNKPDPYESRRAAAEANGLTPDNPAYQSFILTGKMPREDQSPLTATDKKAILEADEMVAANENAITALKQAQEINNQANQGAFASTRGALSNALPDWMVPDAISSKESGAATADFDNLVVGQALQSLKSIFGAAPTEGERKILLDLQGSSGQPANVRASILQRAQALAERRLEFNRQRAEGLRGGSFYQPGGGATGGSTVDDLLKKYGG